MKSNIFTTVRFVMALLTVLAIAGKPYIPPKTLVLHPASMTISSLYGPTDIASGKVATWVDPAASDWQCDYKAIYGDLTCGLAFSWNLVDSNSCSPGRGFPKCERTESDVNGDGWGWENEQSCIVVSTSASGTTKAAWPSTLFCVDVSNDPDGDGWGWENGQSCLIATVGRASEQSKAPDCSNAEADPDGDGWGWENERSCIVLDSGGDRRSQKTEETDVPVCSSAELDPDGDGWGWENERSCMVKKVGPSPQRTHGTADITTESTCTRSESAANQDDNTSTFRSIDFTGYDGLNVKIHYEGRAKFLRLYLRNLNPENTEYKDFTSSKFMSTFLRTEDLKAGAAYVSLTEFSVEEWWILLYNPPRSLAAPEFGHVVSVGLDYVEHGMHRMRVDSIELTGERVSMETFLMGILLLWAAFLLMEGAIRYYLLSMSTRKAQTQIHELTGHARELEKERGVLTTRSVTDPLTGALNRAGMEQQLRVRFPSGNLAPDFGVIVMDIDHFKRINDTYGHDVGDRILQSLSQLVASHIRDGDIFVRWGGEEFVLIPRYKTKKKLMAVAEKLRRLVANHVFEADLDLPITISIGVTAAREGDVFDVTFKRADLALYRAKLTRNTVAFED